MPFDWMEYLTLAQTLAANGDEASKRTAISRAYYFVFHLAYARAERNCGRKPQGPPGTHEWCWDKYSKNADIACRAVGIEGTRLKRLRHDVDYRSSTITRLDDVCN
jgi:hypothetical protein